MNPIDNPFPETDANRHALWEMLVRRDIEAFIAQDWAAVAGDFVTSGFTAIDALRSDNPDHWRLTFASLDDYRQAWLDSAYDTAARCTNLDALRPALYAATMLRDIEVRGDSALLHKKFDGDVIADDGTSMPMHWQTMYQCVRIDGTWKIAGFVGYLPNPMGTTP